MFDAALHCSTAMWNLDDVVAVKLGTAKRTIPAIHGYDRAHLVIWESPDMHDASHVTYDPSEPFDFNMFMRNENRNACKYLLLL